MPTGPKHTHTYDVSHADGTSEEISEPCRCTIGDDHNDSDILSTTEANDIWLSSGMDEDYDFR